MEVNKQRRSERAVCVEADNVSSCSPCGLSPLPPCRESAQHFSLRDSEAVTYLSEGDLHRCELAPGIFGALKTLARSFGGRRPRDEPDPKPRETVPAPLKVHVHKAWT